MIYNKANIKIKFFHILFIIWKAEFFSINRKYWNNW